MKEFNIQKTSLERNPFIGLFLRASDSVVLCTKNAPSKVKTLAEETLGAPLTELFLAESSLIGIFSVLNSTGCIVTSEAEHKEVQALKKTGLNVLKLKSSFAPGNNILVNDTAALVSPLMSKEEAAEIADALGVEVHRQQFAGLKTVGSANIVTNNGLLAFNETSEIELKQLEKWFGVRSGVGTANMGVVYNSLSIVANKKGALVGDLTSGFELQRIFEALGD
ncbi:MAG: translation initiation factor IF-6 [Candidatus Micrarchaeota archaeon]